MTDEAKPEKPEKPKKPYKLFKGTEIPIGEIKTFPAYVQRLEPTGLMPRIMVIRSLADTWKRGHKLAKVWVEGQTTKNMEVSVDRRVVLLEGNRGDALKAAFKSWSTKNPADSLILHPKSLGADPEIFVTVDGKVLPSWEFLGSKARPTPLYPCMNDQDLRDGYQGDPLTGIGAYWDGFQGEFTTRSGTACMAYFVDDIQRGLKAIDRAAKAKNPDAKLSIQSVLPVDPEILATAKEEHVAFGCMPSANVYGLMGNQTPGREVPLRFAGGHIHLGVDRGLRNKESLERAVMGMDAVLGVPSVSLFGAFDVPARRQYYGQAGEYRTPPHGLEYRTLSNAWLMHPVIAHMVYELARVGFDYGLSGLDLFGPQDEIRDIIQSTDPMAAKAYLTKHKAAYMALFKRPVPFKNSGPDLVYQILFNGAESIIQDPEDFTANWNLSGYWVSHSDDHLKNWGNSHAHLQKGEKL